MLMPWFDFTDLSFFSVSCRGVHWRLWRSVRSAGVRCTVFLALARFIALASAGVGGSCLRAFAFRRRRVQRVPAGFAATVTGCGAATIPMRSCRALR